MALQQVSFADREIVEKHGISGINCSWNRCILGPISKHNVTYATMKNMIRFLCTNRCTSASSFTFRLEEIPFKSMGKGRNQRILPLLFAANSVNYGRCEIIRALVPLSFLWGFLLHVSKCISGELMQRISLNFGYLTDTDPKLLVPIWISFSPRNGICILPFGIDTSGHLRWTLLRLLPLVCTSPVSKISPEFYWIPSGEPNCLLLMHLLLMCLLWSDYALFLSCWQWHETLSCAKKLWAALPKRSSEGRAATFPRPPYVFIILPPPSSIRAFRSVVDRLLCMLKVKGSNPLMSMFFQCRN